MKTPFTLILLFAGVCSSFSSQAQLHPRKLTYGDSLFIAGTKHKKVLPDDLPQQKLLFIKYAPVALPAEAPKGFFNADRRLHFMIKNHNESIPEANRQLLQTAANYPYAYRITTLDSVDYYRRRGYKYMLMQGSFNSTIDGTFQGTRAHGAGAKRTYTSTSVDIYVQDLNQKDKYVFNDFSETFIYYYKGQVEMLLKKVAKQFDTKKS